MQTNKNLKFSPSLKLVKICIFWKKIITPKMCMLKLRIEGAAIQ